MYLSEGDICGRLIAFNSFSFRELPAHEVFGFRFGVLIEFQFHRTGVVSVGVGAFPEGIDEYEVTVSSLHDISIVDIEG